MDKVEKLKRAKSNGKTHFVMANQGGIIAYTHREPGDVISCHANHRLAEASPAGRSNLTQICDIDEILSYWDI